MVLMNGSKAARNVGSIINRTNTCGGNKKPGLAWSAFMYNPNNVTMIGAKNTQYRDVCMNIHNHPTQAYGYRAIRGANL